MVITIRHLISGRCGERTTSFGAGIAHNGYRALVRRPESFPDQRWDALKDKQQ